MEREENKLLRMSEAEMTGRFGSKFCKDIKELIRKAGPVNGSAAVPSASPSKPAATPWISVEERKPEMYEQVLVAYTTTDGKGEKVTRWIPAFLNGKGIWIAVTYRIGNVRMVENVTHWAEVSLPKVEETENKQNGKTSYDEEIR